MKNARFFTLGILIAALAISDRLSKQLALKLLSEREGFLIKKILGLGFLGNAKFIGIINIPKIISISVSFIFLTLLVWLLLKKVPRGKKVVAIVFALIGAGSNTADRIIYGQVIDFLIIGPWVINLADLFIIIGILLYLKSEKLDTTSKLVA